MKEIFHNNKFQHWYCDNVEENDKGTAIFSPTNLYNIELVDNFNKCQYWYGDNLEEDDKGTAIFSLTGLNNIDLFDNFNKDFKYIIPYKVSNIDPYRSQPFFNDEYIILSIWLKLASDGSLNYQKALFDALDYYNFDKPIILVGDFNTGSNKSNLDKYEELKTKLKKYGLTNAAENTEFEYESTCFYDKTKKYYINDFCFIPTNFTVFKFFIDKMNTKKGEQELFCHYPIVVDFSG
jgi:hypothetical protein